MPTKTVMRMELRLAQSVRSLPSNHEVLSLVISGAEGVVTHSCNSSVWELETGGSDDSRSSSAKSKFKASLSYTRFCLNNNNKIS